MIKTYFLFLSVLAFVLATPAQAQDARQCEEILSYAETYYQQNRIDEAISLLADCLRAPDVPSDIAVSGNRLLALAFLRNDDVAQARLAIVELLGLDPAYTPDPVNDIPVYKSLVESTRRQMAIEQTLTTTVAQPEAPAEGVAQQDSSAQVSDADGMPTESNVVLSANGMPVSFKVRIGLSGYGGERGLTAESSIGEFGDNAGPAFEIGADYQIATPLSMGIFYGPARYDHLHDAKGSPPDYPIIDSSVSSNWVHYFGLVMRLGYVSNAPIEPFALIGAAAALATVNDESRIGFGPRFGAGLNYWATQQVGIYFEADAMLVSPGNSVDLVDVGGSTDMFTNLGLGIRYRMQ
ncbi:MAG: tetratricopeptide repeat protein [Rhodothermales bacterium]|nr:tetratricopeptide repeat protein [Rhodothermales bacterium]